MSGKRKAGFQMSTASQSSATRPGSVIDLRERTAERPGAVEVAVLDEQSVFRKGVQAQLADGHDVVVVADAGSLPELDNALGGRRPQVFLCSVDMTDPAGEPLSTAIRQRYPDSHVVAVASADDDIELAKAVRGGVRGYLRRDCSLKELHDTVIAAAQGKSVIAPSVASRLLDELAAMVRRSEMGAEGVGALSRREREVLGLVAEGLNNRAIASALFISENTVKNHIRNIHEKLGVHTRMEAVVRAVREGLLTIA